MSSETLSPRIRTLLRQADRVAAANKREAAAKLYRDILEEAPETASAWSGLAKVASDPVEKENAVRKALELNPQLEAGDFEENVNHKTRTDAIAEPEPDDSAATPDTVTIAEWTDSPRSSKKDVLTREGEAGNDIGLSNHVPHPGDDVLTCVNHPGRKTNLRCNRCGKPICTKCANPTPVGYRCPQCIREREDAFYTADLLHYTVALAVSFPLSILAGWIATFLGFWVIFLAAFAGSVIGRIAFWAVGRRRGRWLPHMVAGVIVIGAALVAVLLFLGQPSFRFVWTALYAIIAYGSAYYQMK